MLYDSTTLYEALLALTHVYMSLGIIAPKINCCFPFILRHIVTIGLRVQYSYVFHLATPPINKCPLKKPFVVDLGTPLHYDNGNERITRPMGWVKHKHINDCKY